MNHTPGPWRCGNRSVIITSDAGHVLEANYIWDIEPANQALMIAAPDLLAVALMVLDLATVETPPALIDAATAAVRKAAPDLLRPTPEQARAACGD